MNRRGFMKMLGFGAAAAVVAPQVLAEGKKHIVGVNVITGNASTVAASTMDGAIQSVDVVSHGSGYKIVDRGVFVPVWFSRASRPVDPGDVVRYKGGRKGGFIACKASNRDHGFEKYELGVAIRSTQPGQFSWIQVAGPNKEIVALADGSLKAL